MDVFELTPEVLASLRAPRRYPAITLVLPAEPKDASGEKVRGTLRELCTVAQLRLAEDLDVDQDVRFTLRDEKLIPETIAALIDPSVPAGQIVVYLSATEPTTIWQVPAGADSTPRAEFSESFLTRYLVAAEQRSRPYLVLVLDLELCRLFRGSDERLREIKEHGFPDATAIPSTDDADEYLKRYLHTVDTRLGPALQAHDGLPLFVIGTEKPLSTFLELSVHRDRVAGALPLTGLDKDSPGDLARRIAPDIDKHRAKQVAAAIAELEDARSQHRYAGGPAEVWNAVADKRVHRLVLEDGLRIAGKVTGEGQQLTLMPSTVDVHTDIVEQLVENAVEAGARVLFVPDGTLALTGGIAAVLRY